VNPWRSYRLPGIGAQIGVMQLHVPHNPLAAVPVLAAGLLVVEQLLAETARAAAEATSWAAVGRSLGISRQATRERFF
jgi:hypothetical protein